MGGGRGPLCRPEAGRAGAGIPTDLRLIRFYRTPVKKPEAWCKCRTGSFGEMPRAARRRCAPAGEEPLGDAILERMEGDDHEPASRLEQPLGGRKTSGELVELFVEIKAERLEGPGRWMFHLIALAADHARHDVGKLARGQDRR